jgi:hypothetical protein
LDNKRSTLVVELLGLSGAGHPSGVSLLLLFAAVVGLHQTPLPISVDAKNKIHFFEPGYVAMWIFIGVALLYVVSLLGFFHSMY